MTNKIYKKNFKQEHKQYIQSIKTNYVTMLENKREDEKLQKKSCYYSQHFLLSRPLINNPIVENKESSLLNMFFKL